VLDVVRGDDLVQGHRFSTRPSGWNSSASRSSNDDTRRRVLLLLALTATIRFVSLAYGGGCWCVPE
jgi:hypothetical protein